MSTLGVDCTGRNNVTITSVNADTQCAQGFKCDVVRLQCTSVSASVSVFASVIMFQAIYSKNRWQLPIDLDCQTWCRYWHTLSVHGLLRKTMTLTVVVNQHCTCERSRSSECLKGQGHLNVWKVKVSGTSISRLIDRKYFVAVRGSGSWP